ncbi:MAG: DUF4342 domain-containing protein [Clostridiales bacterium]|nr:DUF4342 domain-containing protein [Clostridiales bacterium]
MDHFDMTEKLREKANVSYEEAKEALERSEWDLLEAIVYLESNGKMKQETRQEEPDMKQETAKKKAQSVGNVFDTISAFVGNLIEKGNRNHLEVHRNGDRLFSLPLTVLALLCLIAFWLVIPVLVIGWFTGCQYRFTGRDVAAKQHDAQPVQDNVEPFRG